jgi:lipopolysaccharide export system permease protein
VFSVCLFVLLMQFLWKYVDIMVGKGVEMNVLMQLFFYAGNSLVPLSLPLAILLASLMTFGNLGERLELLAIKSAGISLIRIMKPLIILIVVISVADFGFQNSILPLSNTKMGTILLSLKQKSPELDIPESVFFKEIPNYNIYVGHKEKNGLLKDMMIYNYSKGYDDAVVIVADSGNLKVSQDKKYLVLSLHSGESFQNMKQKKSGYKDKQIPYVREKFKFKEILISFDSNFNMDDESIMVNRDMSKKMKDLRIFIDSVSITTDSVKKALSPILIGQTYANTFKQDERRAEKTTSAQPDTTYTDDFENLFLNISPEQQLKILENAKSNANRRVNDFSVRMYQQSETKRQLRGHQIELNRRFASSLACLLFFFIGAPLGAIIRKGGLGLPTVVSVFIFILYYTIDLFGFKMAKQGVWPVWQGMWLSTLLLVILGAFFTYKAINDSVIMNPDAWKNSLQRLFGKREMRVYYRKEVIMTPPNYKNDSILMEDWNIRAKQYLSKNKKPLFYISFWKKSLRNKETNRLLNEMDHWIEDLRNSDENLILGKLMDYPVITPLNLYMLNKPAIRRTCALFFPIGIIIYLIYLRKRKQICDDLRISLRVNEEIIKELKI